MGWPEHTTDFEVVGAFRLHANQPPGEVEVIERAAAKAKDGRVYVALLVEEIEALRAAASPRPDQRRASMR